MNIEFKNLEDVKDFVNNRYGEHGRDLKSVGWGDSDSQNLRFETLVRDIEIIGKTFLDVGCGLADLLPFLVKKADKDFKYIGVDLSEKLICDCKKKYPTFADHFLVGSADKIDVPEFDYAVVSGTLSYKFDGVTNYSKSLIGALFDKAKAGVLINCLSTRCDYQLPKNQHYDPLDILSWAFELSDDVNMFHDYPLFEFTVQIFKQP